LVWGLLVESPLDVGVFSLYKHWHSKSVDAATRTGCTNYTKIDMLAALKDIRTKTFKRSTIVSAIFKILSSSKPSGSASWHWLQMELTIPKILLSPKPCGSVSWYNLSSPTRVLSTQLRKGHEAQVHVSGEALNHIEQKS
jgi:hypothetical protein